MKEQFKNNSNNNNKKIKRTSVKENKLQKDEVQSGGGKWV